MNQDLCGVILAGGRGTRLGHLTRVTNKHLLPVGPYPMIYYPLKKLVGAGIRDILLVSGTEHMGDFIDLLGSGRAHDCRLTYRVQDEAGGIAQALGLAEHFCQRRRCVVLLGDNIFAEPLTPLLHASGQQLGHAWVFLRSVADPQRYGVATLRDQRLVAIEEKPADPASPYAVAGIYIYPTDVFDFIKELVPSPRGELEITDVNNRYLRDKRLGHQILQDYWTDAGTLESWTHANRLVQDRPPTF